MNYNKKIKIRLKIYDLLGGGTPFPVIRGRMSRLATSTAQKIIPKRPGTGIRKKVKSGISRGNKLKVSSITNDYEIFINKYNDYVNSKEKKDFSKMNLLNANLKNFNL